MPDVPANHTGQPIFATSGIHRGAINALACQVDTNFWQNNGVPTLRWRWERAERSARAFGTLSLHGVSRTSHAGIKNRSFSGWERPVILLVVG